MIRFKIFISNMFNNLENVEKAIREIFSIPEGSNIHLWTKSSNQSYEELPQKKQSIQELSLMSNQTVVAEVQNEDGTWPRKTSYSKRLVESIHVYE